MVNNFLFKVRDGQTPLPNEFQKGLIPKNIQTMAELDEYEEHNMAKGIIWLEASTQKYMDYSFWCKLHYKLFGEVWQWAGEIRNYELNNPDFLEVYKIRPALMKLIGDLKFWLDNETFPPKQIIAKLHERLLTIHPFANGNGRWARILTEYICQKNTISTPRWGENFANNPAERREKYIQAVENARHKKNFKLLEEIIFS